VAAPGKKENWGGRGNMTGPPNHLTAGIGGLSLGNGFEVFGRCPSTIWLGLVFAPQITLGDPPPGNAGVRALRA
jgi:hypothetical protein